jgi:polyhydroxyalkanoate synthesis regulator phasin
MTEARDQEGRRAGSGGTGGIGEGIRTGIGILNAFREAIEETIQEAVDKGEFGPERARRAVHDATARMQEGLEDARERFDFVARKDLDALRAEVAELRGRVDALETTPRASGPDDSGIIIEPA